MRDKAESIATKVESIYTGLVAVHKELVEELTRALDREYSVVSALEAIDRIYPVGNMPTIYLISVLAQEMDISYEQDLNDPRR